MADTRIFPLETVSQGFPPKKVLFLSPFSLFSDILIDLDPSLPLLSVLLVVFSTMALPSYFSTYFSSMADTRIFPLETVSQYFPPKKLHKCCPIESGIG